MIGIAASATADHLKDRNVAEIGNNSAQIGNDAAGIDIAAKAIPC